MAVDREVLKIVVVGHVDHGKSTVIGRLLYDTKSLPEGAIDRVKRISKEKGKPFEYAYLLDAFEEEQKQGITIDTTQLQFFTEKRDYVIIDAPGHKEFLKNMISGAANAEAALLIVDANEGIQEQSKRHGYILSLLGIQKVYVLINKMDIIQYSQEKFNEIRQDMNEFLNNLHIYPLKYIPISAFYGENMTSPSGKMPWYKGEPVLQAIDLIEKDKGLGNKPLRFPIQDVYKFDARRIIAGRIESGTLKVGDEVLISPGSRVTKVKSIEYWAKRDETQAVEAGMSVGITVADEFFNQRGEFISQVQDAPLVADAFKASIFWMGKKALQKGAEYKLKLVTQETECEIQAITKVIDATTLEHIDNASRVKTNDVAEVIIRTKKPVCFDPFKNNSNTGRFVLVDGYDVSGGGIISGPIKEIQHASTFVYQDVQMAVHCFDEYFYALQEGTVKKIEARPHAFHADDVISLTGETYEYPENFDVVNVTTRSVARIRKARLQDITGLDSYHYEGVPLINDHGSLIRIGVKEDVSRFISELTSFHGSDRVQATFANQWFDFMKFRTIRYWRGDQSLEYQI